jgi:cell division protein FtsB
MNRGREERVPGTSFVLRPLLLLGYVLLLMGLVAFSTEAYRELERQRTREQELARRVAAAKARIQQARQAVERRQRDPLALERLAREQLGWVRPHEVVLVLPAPGNYPDPEVPSPVFKEPALR